MKVVILAGGLGTRLSEETGVRPKPLVAVGGRPILWHIMKIYSTYGFNEFIICCGYKGYLIKEFFANYFLHTSDVTFDLKQNRMITHQSFSEPWKVTLVDTGDDTMTGGRIRRVRHFLNNEPFMLSYGDGVAEINIQELVAFHESHGKLATLTAVQPPGRFGALDIRDGNTVHAFFEKPGGDGGYVNGGFFVLEPQVLELLKDDRTIWERAPMEKLAKDGQLKAFHHNNFWLPMDTLRDKVKLDELWASGKAPWKSW